MRRWCPCPSSPSALSVSRSDRRLASQGATGGGTDRSGGGGGRGRGIRLDSRGSRCHVLAHGHGVRVESGGAAGTGRLAGHADGVDRRVGGRLLALRSAKPADHGAGDGCAEKEGPRAAPTERLKVSHEVSGLAVLEIS